MGDDQTNKMCRGHKLASLKWADESGVPLRGRVILSTINCCPTPAEPKDGLEM